MVRFIRDLFLARPDNKNVKLKLSVADGLPHFQADRTQLQSALLQLLENTLFYAEEKPKIVLSASAGEDGVRLSINVDGAMFPAQEVALLTATEQELGEASESQILGDSSSLLSAREAFEAQAGDFLMEAQRKDKQVAFTIRFRSNEPIASIGEPLDD